MPGSSTSKDFWPWLMPGPSRTKRPQGLTAISLGSTGNTLTRYRRDWRVPNKSVKSPSEKPGEDGPPRSLRVSIVSGCRPPIRTLERTRSTFSTNPSGPMPRVEEHLPPFLHQGKHPREAHATQGSHRRAMPVFREGEAGTETDAPRGAPCHRAVRVTVLTGPTGTSRTSTPNVAHGQRRGRLLAGRGGVQPPRGGKEIP